VSAVHPVRSRPMQGERLGAGERTLLVARTPSLSPTTFPCSSTHICKEITRLLDRRELSFSKEPFSSDESFPQSMRCSQQFMRDEILYFAYIYDDSTSR
jgi:hypothetical protein